MTLKVAQGHRTCCYSICISGQCLYIAPFPRYYQFHTAYDCLWMLGIICHAYTPTCQRQCAHQTLSGSIPIPKISLGTQNLKLGHTTLNASLWG